MRTMTSRFGLAALLCGVCFLATWADDTSGGNPRHKASEARVLGDLQYLAGDECEGRGIRTEGINKAADYIAKEFKKAGLKPGGTDGWFQPFEVFARAELEEGKLSVQGTGGEKTDLENSKDYNIVAFGGTGSASAPLVFVGYGLDTPQQNDYAGVDVAGKVVIVIRNLPEESKDSTPRFSTQERTKLMTLRSKAETAKKHQAAGILFVNDIAEASKNEDRLLSFNTTGRDRAIGNLPMAHVRRAVVNKLLEGTDLATLEKTMAGTGKPKSMELKGCTCAISTKIKRSAINVKNVIGIMEGSGPLADEAIVIGAHYDHLGRGEPGSLARGSKEIHYGADDNASGSTSVIELARRFGAKKDYVGRKLIFMTFSAEESGLLGSAYYCREPVYPLEKTAAMVNLDMVGRLREKKLILLGAQTAAAFERIIDESNAELKLKINATNSYGRYFAASDHYSFFEKKIPVLFLFTDVHPEYHTPKDKVETINIEGLRECCDLAEGMLDRLCVLTPRPEFVSPAPSAQQPRRGQRDRNVPRLGFRFDYNDDKEGALLSGVGDGSQAAKAGFKGGDRIVEIGGKPVKNLEVYMTLMPTYKKGDTIEFTILRDEKREKIKVTLE